MPLDAAQSGSGSMKGYGSLSPPISRREFTDAPSKMPVKSVAFSMPDSNRGRGRSNGNVSTLDQSRPGSPGTTRAGSHRHASPPPAKEPLPKPERPVSISPRPQSPSILRARANPPSKTPVKYPLPSQSPANETTPSRTQTWRSTATEAERIIPPPGMPTPVRAGSLYNSSPVPEPPSLPPPVPSPSNYAPNPSPLPQPTTVITPPYEEVVVVQVDSHTSAPHTTGYTGKGHSGQYWTDSGRTQGISEEDIRVIDDNYTHRRSGGYQGHVKWSERDRELYERYMDVSYEATNEA